MGARDPARAVGQFVCKRWSSENDLPAQHIYAITQTNDGYLWVGADTGLFRFDGFAFTRIRDEGSNGFPIDYVYGLVADKSGNLWVQLSGPTLLRYRDGRFTASTPGASNEDPRVTAIARATDGRLILASRRGGAGFWDGSRFQMIAGSPLLVRSPVVSITDSSTGDIWLGTDDDGLIRINGHRFSNVRKGLPDLKINCLLSKKDGALLVGTDHGFFRWNGRYLTGAGVPETLKHIQILKIIQDRDSNVWIGTGTRGLLRLNEADLSSLHRPRPDLRATALFEDREGDLWVGGGNGLEQLRDNAFATYASGPVLSAENNGPIFCQSHDGDAHNTIWWGPAHGGLYWLSRGKIRQVTEAGLTRDEIYSITGDDRNLWLGRRRGGLTHLVRQGRSVSLNTYTASDGLAENSIYSVHQDRDGSVWAGTLRSGVSHFHHGRFDNYSRADGLAANMVRSMVEGSDGTMWFATPAGLSSFASDQWSTYKVEQGLPSENAYSLLVSSDGVVWVGTQRGICFLHAGKFKISAGLPASLREPIFGIEEDKCCYLWLVTAKGVLRVARSKLLRGPLKESDVREYGVADGLQDSEGVPRDSSIGIDEAGRIWISRKCGLAMVDPARLSISVSTITSIDHLTVDGGSVDLQNFIEISSNPRRIEIGYTGLNLAAPERVRFRFRLDGFDRTWSTPIKKRDIFFTNLGPGSYRFHITASVDGIWNGPEALMQFRVDPAMWQTWWFRFGVVLLFVAAFVTAYHWRIHQLTARVNLRFDERLAERTRLARELHDTLLQTIEGSKLVADDALDTESNELDKWRMLMALEKLSVWLGDATKEARVALNSLRNPVHQEDNLIEAFQRVAEECIHTSGTFDENELVCRGSSPRITPHSSRRDLSYRS